MLTFVSAFDMVLAFLCQGIMAIQCHVIVNGGWHHFDGIIFQNNVTFQNFFSNECGWIAC